MNNNFIVFNKDGTKDGLAFPITVTEPKALEHYKFIHPKCEDRILKYFYIRKDKTPISIYMTHYTLSEDLKLTMDLKHFMKTKRMEEIRQKRDFFIAKLDIPFMQSLEHDDQKLKKHIVKLKKFLRDIPEDPILAEMSDDKKILEYNPFGNIFEIIVLKRGSGYDLPPKITIDGPKGGAFGVPAKGLAFIENGEVIKVELTYRGCAYDYIPRMTIEPPANGEQAFAICSVPQNIMISQQDIESNTLRHYS